MPPMPPTNRIAMYILTKTYIHGLANQQPVFCLVHPFFSSGLLLRLHLSLHNNSNDIINNNNFLLPSIRSLLPSRTHNQKYTKHTLDPP